MAKAKKPARIRIPARIEAAVLTASAHRCVVCGSQSIQIHHINGNPADNRIANLVVLCLDHHDQSERSGGLVKKITPAQLRAYKRSWEQKIIDGTAPPIRTSTALRLAAMPGPSSYLIDARYASDHIRIFISSKMRRKPLQAERVAAAEAIESLPNHRAWYWERDAKSGPYSTEPLCIRNAQASQGLILLLGATLTEMTEKEYSAARNSGVPRYIFLKAGARPKQSVRDFIRVEREGNVYQRFSNLNELKSLILDSVLEFERMSVQSEIGRRRMTARTLSI